MLSVRLWCDFTGLIRKNQDKITRGPVCKVITKLERKYNKIQSCLVWKNCWLYVSESACRRFSKVFPTLVYSLCYCVSPQQCPVSVCLSQRLHCTLPQTPLLLGADEQILLFDRKEEGWGGDDGTKRGRLVSNEHDAVVGDRVFSLARSGQGSRFYRVFRSGRGVNSFFLPFFFVFSVC